MWGGWSRTATPETRKAYQLNKMDNCWSLTGQAVENSVMAILRSHQAGTPANPEEAYETIARPFLRAKWTESKRGRWKEDPKQYCCLREHYYGTMGDEQEIAGRMAEQIRTCIDHFIHRALPRLAAVRPEEEIPVKTVEQGDPEHIFWNGIKIYVIPDYAYQLGDTFHIHDWKAGKIKASHREQLGLYALWARETRAATLENTFLYVEYLKEGQVAPFQMTVAEAAALEQRIACSVAEMTEYLVGADRERNEALPKEEWDLAASPAACRDCNFFELCQPELE